MVTNKKNIETFCFTSYIFFLLKFVSFTFIILSEMILFIIVAKYFTFSQLFAVGFQM